MLIFVLVVSAFVIGLSVNVSAQQSPTIPSWIKNTAKWWGEGQISDDEFIKALQWLISQGILHMPQSENSQARSQVQSTQTNPLSAYLPNSDDLGSSWQIRSAIPAVSNLKYPLSHSIEQSFKKESSISSTLITIDLYNFTFIDAADGYFQSAKNVLPTGGQSYDAVPYTNGQAKCVEAEVRNGDNQGLMYLCEQGSTVIFIEGQGTDVSLKNDVVKLTEITLGKVPYYS